jgi:hypothetical protein
MDNWFTWSEQFIKDSLAWFILLAILSGAIWGVWSSVVKEIGLYRTCLAKLTSKMPS